jgi:hypothetical protein
MRSRLMLVPAALLALAGCDSPPAPVTTNPVTGKVLYDGKPAAGVKVFLFPTSAPMIPQIPANPHGVTGPDGTFTVSTFKDGDGAAEGGYQVILLWPPEAKEGEEASEEDRLLGWYTAVNSKLTVHIKAGENNLPPFNLPFQKYPPPESKGIPGRN